MNTFMQKLRRLFGGEKYKWYYKIITLKNGKRIKKWFRRHKETSADINMIKHFGTFSPLKPFANFH